MENEKPTPKQNTEIISLIISEAKSKFQENGFIFVLWGVLITLTSFSQFVLLNSAYTDINYYPYFIIPFGVIYSGYYMYKKEKGEQNQISKIIGISWTIISVNILILAFVFAPLLKSNLIPLLLILLGISFIITGGTLKCKLLLYSGIFINISGIICFNIDWQYHSLLMSIVSFLAIFIPGLVLMIEHKRNNPK